MGSALIQLVQDTAMELGLPVPSAVVRAQDNTGRQLGALANRCGRHLLRMHDWTFLTREWHLTVPAPVEATADMVQGSDVLNVGVATAQQILVNRMLVTGQGIMTSVRVIAADTVNGTATMSQPATLTQTGADVVFRVDSVPEPADYERAIHRTQWDRTMRWELRGPQSPQSDQWVRSGIVATGPRRMYRQVDNYWRIWPPPSTSDAGSQLISEYVSNYWVMDAGGNAKPRFTADQDTCYFEDDVVITGLKYLFFSIKGFATDDLLKQFMRVVQNAVASDGPSPTLDMDRTRFPIFISPSNVQDSDYPGSFGNR